MSFEETFEQMKAFFEKKDYEAFGTGIYSYEFDVTGEGEGKFYLEITDGHPDMRPFDYKNSLCAFVINSAHLAKLINRELSPIAAYSTGRLTVKGDVSAAFRLADVVGLGV